MADHLRRQIRESIAAAVTGLASTGSRVYQSRVYRAQETALPCLLIRAGGEAVTPLDMNSPVTLQRTFSVSLEVVAQDVGNLDDALDAIAKEVEVAIAAMTLPGISSHAALTSISEPELTGEGDQPIGRAVMTYDVTYFALENAPDTAL